jgi:hypothetical protein
MLNEARELTERIYSELLELPFNINRHDGPVSISESIKVIDTTDLVISYPGTFASLAIARGKPVVMYGQGIKPHDGYSDGTLKYVQHWSAYYDYMRYHYDISDTDPEVTESIIRRAALVEESDWRSRYIGEQMQPEVLMEALNSLYK